MGQSFTTTATVENADDRPIVTFSSNGFPGEWAENVQVRVNEDGVANNNFEPAGAGEGGITASLPNDLSASVGFTVAGGELNFDFYSRYLPGQGNWTYEITCEVKDRDGRAVQNRDGTMHTSEGHWSETERTRLM